MHELHATQNILDAALQHASKAEAQQVTDVFLVNGSFSTMDDEAVRFYWEMLSKGTICESARLHFTHVSAKAVCDSCGKTFEPDEVLSACPRCESGSVRVTQGKEFFLNEIEVDKGNLD